MKKIKGFWLLATACCIALLAACSDDDFDEPAPSTVDTSEWPLTGYMDTLSYRAGDDFFMYCNGNYWKTTDLGDANIKGFLDTEVEDYINQLISQTNFPHEDQLEALANAVKDKPLTDAEMEEYMAPVLEIIDEASTVEDCIKLFARLYKMGYNIVLPIKHKVVDGLFKPTLETFYYYPVNNASIAKKSQSTQQQLIDHPELAEKYHPLANTRSDGNDVVTILATELGLNPQDVLVSDDELRYFATYLTAPVEEMKADLARLVWVMDQPFMNPNLAEESFNYLGSFSPGYKFDSWKRDIYRNCKYTSSYAFVAKWLTPQMVEDMTGKCEELRSVFRRRIADLDWMSGTTKQRTIEKLDMMTLNVGYPKNWVKEALVDFSQCQTMIEAVRMARKADVDLQFSFLGKDIKEHSFNAFLHTYKSSCDLRSVSASYIPTYNSIDILPPIMLPPLYDADAHESLQYATLYVIAHEMTHGFDAEGAKYDGLGNVSNWWTLQDMMNFEERYQKLIDCYNHLEMLPWDPDYAGKYCPGKQTLIENISDLGGFEIAHQAYIEKCQREGYYGEELDKQDRKFYQAYANLWRSKYTSSFITNSMIIVRDIHSMSRERINGVVMNTDRWYELYNVQWGDHLYLHPENRTHLW